VAGRAGALPIPPLVMVDDRVEHGRVVQHAMDDRDPIGDLPFDHGVLVVGQCARFTQDTIWHGNLAYVMQRAGDGQRAACSVRRCSRPRPTASVSSNANCVTSSAVEWLCKTI